MSARDRGKNATLRGNERKWAELAEQVTIRALTGEIDSGRVRERDGVLEFVINLEHAPIVVETWFGGPSVELVDRYSAWLDGFITEARTQQRRMVFLHDATRAGMPSSDARQRLTLIPAPPDVIIDRVIVFDSPVIRGAVSALAWIIGSPYRTARSLDEGVAMCRSLLERERIDPPPTFVLTPESASD